MNNINDLTRYNANNLWQIVSLMRVDYTEPKQELGRMNARSWPGGPPAGVLGILTPGIPLFSKRVPPSDLPSAEHEYVHKIPNISKTS